MRSTAVISRLIEHHCREADWIHVLRSLAVHDPGYMLSEVAALDDRLEAHLDALRVAEVNGIRAAQELLDDSGPKAAFVAGVLAFETEDEERIGTLIQLCGSDAAFGDRLVSALGWLSQKQAERHIKRLAASKSAAARRFGIAGAAIHRYNPGNFLLDALHDPDAALKARALRAAGELGRLDLRRVLEENLDAPDDDCRFAAAWSACLLSIDTKALQVLRSIAELDGPKREKAMQVALRRMELTAAHAWRADLGNSSAPNSIRWGIIAAGVIGDPTLVPWLIEHMKNPPLSRVAGEAFSMITGADLAKEHLRVEKPEGFESGPNENPDDENVGMDPDGNLDWPDPVRVAKWWSACQRDFQKGIRHLLGKPVTVDWMQQVLRIGKQQQRAAAALELAIHQPGETLFNVAAPAFRQQQTLGLRTWYRAD